MESETKITYWDYKTIREKSHRIDCTVSAADFNTNHPNPCRMNALVSDINRYLKYEGAERL